MRRSKSTSSHCVCYSVCLVALAFLVFSVVILYTSIVLLHDNTVSKQVPLAINTWPFIDATAVAWNALYNQNKSAIDAVELGCSVCEEKQCDLTVGFGGSPDENGETTLDAFIMDGETMNVGAVAALRNIKSAISVARRVLENTKHSILAGELATQFAISMGFTQESLSTNQSKDIYTQWISAKCQPNYWTSVTPDPSKECGPYRPVYPTQAVTRQTQASHDTISMITLDRDGLIAVGTSSNGANHKVPGRVGDAPLVGAGGYADGTVGAACCTGDGDVMMRFLPSFLAVEEMRRGVSPGEAARTAISRIARYYPSFSGAIIVVNVMGEYAAACHGLNEFPFSVHSVEFPSGKLVRVPCV